MSLSPSTPEPGAVSDERPAADRPVLERPVLSLSRSTLKLLVHLVSALVLGVLAGVGWNLVVTLPTWRVGNGGTAATTAASTIPATATAPSDRRRITTGARRPPISPPAGKQAMARPKAAGPIPSASLRSGSRGTIAPKIAPLAAKSSTVARAAPRTDFLAWPIISATLRVGRTPVALVDRRRGESRCTT